MNAPVLYALNPTQTKGSLHAFKMTRNNNGTHKGAAMGLFPYQLTKKAVAALKARLSLKEKSLHYCVIERVMRTYDQVFDHSLEMHVTDDTITEMNSKIASFVKTLSLLLLECAKEL